jgi:hypothetical protein
MIERIVCGEIVESMQPAASTETGRLQRERKGGLWILYWQSRQCCGGRQTTLAKMYPQAYTLKEGTTWAGAMFTGVNTDPYWETVSLCVDVIAYTVYQQQSPINTE